MAKHLLDSFIRRCRQTLHLMVGLPSYRTYLARQRELHPDCPVMSHKEFFRERQEARYGGKKRIGCC